MRSKPPTPRCYPETPAPPGVQTPATDTSRHGKISQNATNEPERSHTCGFHRFKSPVELRQIRAPVRHLTASHTIRTKFDRCRREWLPDTPRPNHNRNRNRESRVAPSACNESPPAPAPPSGMIHPTVALPTRKTAGEKTLKGALTPSVIYRGIPKHLVHNAYPASFVELDNLAARPGDQRVPCRLVLLGRYGSYRPVAHGDIRPLRVCRAAVDLSCQLIFALVSG